MRFALVVTGLHAVLAFTGRQQLRERFGQATIGELELNNLKAEGVVQLWRSTNLEVDLKTSDMDVTLSARSTWPGTKSYYESLVASAGEAAERQPFVDAFPAVSATCFLAGGVLVPFLSLPQPLSNTLGLLLLAAPFLALAFAQLFPAALQRAQERLVRRRGDEWRQRVSYHEAGHFLCAYLCGLPLLSFSLDGDSGPSHVELGLSPSSSYSSSSTSSLLIVAMAGMVAESLLSGQARAEGGGNDIIACRGLLLTQAPSLFPTPPSPSSPSSSFSPSPSTQGQGAGKGKGGFQAWEREGAMRWAVLKAIALLRLHRKSLDAAASVMQAGGSVAQVILAIEEAASGQDQG